MPVSFKNNKDKWSKNMMSLDNFVETEKAKPWKPKKKKTVELKPSSNEPVTVEPKSRSSDTRHLQSTLEPTLIQNIELIITDLVKSIITQKSEVSSESLPEIEQRILLLEQSMKDIQQENMKLLKEVTNLKRVINQQNEKITTMKNFLVTLEKEVNALHPEIDEKIIQAIKTMSRGLKKAFILSQE